MLSKVLRLGILVLGVAALTSALLPDTALGRGGHFGGGRGNGFGWHGAVYGGVAVALGIGLGYGYYGYPLDDTYDPPYGYGEYAEYGPWAYRGYAGDGCGFTQRRLRTAYGPRWQTVRICNRVR